MLYPFMTLADETEIVHSELLDRDGRESVKVCVEKPVDGGFVSAVCWLPEYRWENIHGFTPAQVERLDEVIRSLSHVIIELARDGGFDRAAAV